VAHQRQPRVLSRHTAPVVDDLDPVSTRATDNQLDPARPRVDGIFEKLLDNGGRPLHDFAGGNLVNQIIREYPDEAVTLILADGALDLRFYSFRKMYVAMMRSARMRSNRVGFCRREIDFR
jgi:hypothetical protein